MEVMVGRITTSVYFGGSEIPRCSRQAYPLVFDSDIICDSVFFLLSFSNIELIRCP